MLSYSNINEIFDCPNLNKFLKCTTNDFKRINLLCLHVNIRSTIKNFNILEQCILSCQRKVDVVILTEANISDSIKNLYNIDGYVMHSELRSGRRGGGITMYINKNHKFTRKNIKTNHFECLTGKITTTCNYSANLCAVYRPPSNCKHLFIDELQRTIDKYDSSMDFYLLGDTNIDTKSDSPVKHRYINMLSSRGLECGISDYTRIETIKNKVTKSCIDHIYARSRTQHLYTAALATVLADHRAIVVASMGPPTNVGIQVAPKIKVAYDFNKLSDMLSNIDWTQTETLKCPLQMYQSIKNNINKCYNESQKYIRVNTNSKRNNHWINKKTSKACEYKEKMYNLWKKDSKNMILKLNYTKARNFANKLINKTKNNYMRQEIYKNMNNSKNLWQIINKMSGRIKSSIDNIILNAFTHKNVSPTDIANNFAHTFSQDVKKIIPQCHIPLIDKSIYKKPVNVTLHFQKATADNVNKIIKSLSSDKAPGVDGIRASDLKLIATNVNKVIAKLINTTISACKYPKELKTGIVRPIHKKSSVQEYANYRPITILPTIDKIIEKFISKQIYNFYGKNSILTSKQFGFQPNKSTTQLLSHFTDVINSHLNDRMHVLVVFIDFSKAFDTLRHDVLIDCLDECGIRGKLLEWCRDYLSDRSYSVRVAEASSNEISVTEGTAQGSVLGPLHYLSYVNNLANLLLVTDMYMFADDTCLLAADRDISKALQRLQTDFTILNQWSHDVGLVLNASKTKLMYISSSQNRTDTPLKLIAHTHPCLHTRTACGNVGCPSIEQVSCHTYLGLVIDDRMTWKPHINSVCDKLRAILAKFVLIKNKIPYSIRLLLYKSLGESIIAYGLSSYGRTFKTNIDQIYHLQIRILKRIVPYKIKIKYKYNYQQLFNFCEILPIQNKIKFSILIEQFFNTELQKRINHPKLTRSIAKKQLAIPNFNNLYGKRTLKYIVPYLINELTPELKEEITIKNIKFKLKQFFVK